MLQIRHSSSAEEIRALAAQGWEPIECSIGGHSIVGPLVMDHHGERSHLEGVAIRAYRDHLGARASDPRFVVTGTPDADATFAIAALAGRLPTKKDVNLQALSELIDRVDRDPIGVDLTENHSGAAILLFNAIVTGRADADLFAFGATFWRQVAHGLPGPLLDAAAAVEKKRLDAARLARVLYSSGGVHAVSAHVWGFDAWYGRRGGDGLSARDWEHPVVILHDVAKRKLTIGCPNERVAEELFGPGGLATVFPKLAPAGWGGRPSIGGSPRGLELPEEAAAETARAVLALVRK